MEKFKKITKVVTAVVLVLAMMLPAVYQPVEAEAAEKGGFYYNLLNAKEKKVYDTIASQIIHYPNKGVNLETKLSAEQCGLVAEYFLLDNPQIFWLNQDISIYYAADKVFYLEYAAIECDETAFRQFVTEIVAEAECYAEEYHQIRTVYEAIAKKVAYDYDVNNIYVNQTTYSAVTGKSVCLGMSKLFMHCLRELGFDSMIVLTETHAFNYVNLNGKWYIADITLDGLYDKAKDKVSLKYFMLGQKGAGYIKEKYQFSYPKLASKNFSKEVAYKKLTGKKKYTTWSGWEYRLESSEGKLDQELYQEQPVDLYFWYCFGDPTPANSSPYWNIWKNGRLLTMRDYHEYFIEVDFSKNSGSGYFVNTTFPFLDYKGEALVREAASNDQYYSTEVDTIRIFPHNSRQVVKAYKIRTRERVE